MSDTLPRAAQPEYLTDALRRSGALGSGRVRDVVVQSSKVTILSRIIRLRLSYTGAAESAPASLILKTGLPERAGARWNSGCQEVAFYTQIAAAMSARLVPRCFDAVWCEERNDWHLLLEDLTDTHFALALWPMPPTREESERLIAARAHFHAHWWDDPRLGDRSAPGWSLTTRRSKFSRRNLSGSPIASATAYRRSAGASTSA